jgi:hypothetical protein
MHHHDQTPNPHMQHCLEACAACAQICDRCADDMIGMEKGSHKELQDLCIRLCMDCADFCALSTRWMSRLSPSTVVPVRRFATGAPASASSTRPTTRSVATARSNAGVVPLPAGTWRQQWPDLKRRELQCFESKM